MKAAQLALYHMREVEKINRALPPAMAWLKANRDKAKRFHITAALIVIAYAGGRRVRDEARQLLRGLK